MKDKEGIKNYYLGLNSVLPKDLQVAIPEDFVSDIYNYRDLDIELITDEKIKTYRPTNNKFTYSILLIQKMYGKKMILFGQNYAQPFKCSTDKYPDCGESTIRNFINVLVFNKLTNKLDIEL